MKLSNYNSIKILGILLPCFFAVWILSYIAGSDVTEADDNSKIRNIINEYFPNYTLKDMDGLDPVTRDYFKEHYPNSNPSVVHSDFDGNGFLDFAVLLQTLDSNGGKTMFAILLGRGRNQFNLAYNLDMGASLDYVYVIPIEPGKILTQTESIETPRENIRLKYAAVELVYFEKAAIAYYWDDKSKQFSSIQTRD